MMEAMRRIGLWTLVLAGLVAAAAGWATPARATCISSWSKSEYKSYGQVQADVRSLFGNVRILKVALCIQGSGSYFQIVVMDGKGIVRTLQIGAHENAYLPRSNGPAPSPAPALPPPSPMPLAPPPASK